MNTLSHLIASALIAAWIGTIATFSIQNITNVSFKFLLFESIKMPIGVVLSLSVGVGLILGSMLPLFLGKSQKISSRRWTQSDREDDLDEFDF